MDAQKPAAQLERIRAVAYDERLSHKMAMDLIKMILEEG